MHEVCETTGHNFTPRYQRVYEFPYENKRQDSPDFPILMILIGVLAAFVASCASMYYKIVWVVYAPYAFLAISVLIFAFSRFRKQYIYDICPRCGEVKKKS